MSTTDTPSSPSPASKEPLNISAEKACAEIARDTKGAEAMFNDRPLTVTGVVYDFWGGNHLVRLYGGEKQFVDVLIDNAEMPPKYKHGQIVTVTGRGDYFGQISDFLSVKDCKFVSAEPYARPAKPLPCFVSTTVEKLLNEAANSPDAVGDLVLIKKNKVVEQLRYNKTLIVEGIVARDELDDLILTSPSVQGRIKCDFADAQDVQSIELGQKVTVFGQYLATYPEKDGKPLTVSLQHCYPY